MSYIFKLPAVAYEVPFSFEGLSTFIEAGRTKHTRKLGTTVTVFRRDDKIEVWLYQTLIGTVSADEVWISPAIDSHGSQATTRWVQKLLNDNRVGGFVCRENGRYAVAGQRYPLATAVAR